MHNTGELLRACAVNVRLGKPTSLDMASLGLLGRKISTQTHMIDKLMTRMTAWLSLYFLIIAVE